MRTLVLGLVLGLAGCGSVEFGGKEKGASEDSPRATSYLVQDAAALPACDESSEGWLVYVKAESKMKACSGGAWTDVDLKIPQEMKIAGTMNCTGMLKDTVVMANYNLTQFTSGDTFVSFQVSTPAAASTNSIFYGAKQAGNADASINAPLDASGELTGGYFTAKINRTNGVVTILYKDSEFAGDLTWDIPISSCVANDFTKS